MQHRAIAMARDYVELQRSENRHQADSHAADGSKRLKYGQMITIRDAVITVPQLSATILSRDRSLHDSPNKTIPPEHMRSFRYQVYRTR